MNIEKLKNELIYIIITIVFYLGSFYLDLYKPIIIYLLVRIWLREIFSEDKNG